MSLKEETQIAAEIIEEINIKFKTNTFDRDLLKENYSEARKTAMDLAVKRGISFLYVIKVLGI
jgi:hypothetical protein